MRLQRNLNIDNTYRVLNLNFFPKHKDWIRVNFKNRDRVLETLHDNKGADYTYFIDQDKSDDLQLNQLVFGCAGKIIYYTRNVIPTTVFLKIGTNRKALYLYEMQDFNKALIENINTASIVSTVAIYAPHVKVDANPFDYIFKANDVRFIADRLYFDFDSKVTIEDKEAFFDKVHEVLARWTIQLYLSYNNEKEKDKLKSDIINKYN